MATANLELTRAGGRVAIGYDNAPMVIELGAGIPLDNQWRWTFDQSLRLLASVEERGELTCIDFRVEAPSCSLRLRA